MQTRRLALLLVALPATAFAVSLDDLVPAWTVTVEGQAGSDGVDASNDVTINAFGDVVSVGYLDGAVGHEKDSFAVAYGLDGVVKWDLTQDVGEVGPTQLSSDDRLEGVTVDILTDNLAWCGRQGGSGFNLDPLAYYSVQTYSANPKGGAYPPVSEWETSYVDGNGSTSPLQDCFGVEWSNGYVYAAGWGQHAADEGRWVSFRYDEVSGLSDPPYFYEFAAFPAVPDQAHDVSVHTAFGDFAIVGQRGFSGLAGSDLNDTDALVRVYDTTGTFVWEDRQFGASLLEDAFNATVIDVATSTVVAAGFKNNGTDNANGSDRDWWVVQYSLAGDINWVSTFGDGSDMDEVATAVDLDEFGDILVGGWMTDAASGNTHWRVAKLSSYDGTELQSWEGPIYSGDAMLSGMKFRVGRIAMSGWIDDGAGPDFATTLLDGDRDADGTADAVDACPDDPLKDVDTGLCGCNVPDSDTDGDGIENCLEECPTDPLKTEPGICGCDEVDDDTDGDGTADCTDNCPDDPNKVEWGICGCGAPDTDTDGDGVLGCDDACSNTPPDIDVDEFGCPLEDVGTDDTGGEDGTDAGSDGDKEGCGCSTGAPGSLVGVLLVGLLTARRRQR